MKYGIQLYSMRDLAEKDFEGAVAKAAEIGYSSIEFAGFFGRTAEQVVSLLQKNNIELFGTHCGMYDLVNDFEGTLAFHKAIGNKNYIISHHNMRNKAEIDEFVGLVNKYQPMLESEGIKLGYPHARIRGDKARISQSQHGIPAERGRRYLAHGACEKNEYQL